MQCRHALPDLRSLARSTKTPVPCRVIRTMGGTTPSLNGPNENASTKQRGVIANGCRVHLESGCQTQRLGVSTSCSALRVSHARRSGRPREHWGGHMRPSFCNTRLGKAATRRRFPHKWRPTPAMPHGRSTPPYRKFLAHSELGMDCVCWPGLGTQGGVPGGTIS